MLGLVRGLCIIAAFVSSAASSGHAQTDLTAAKQAVRECVAQVRQEATRRENYDQFGQPAMWRNFDAYVSPDGLVHNNTKLVGEQDGVYRFEKCLADHGFSLGSGASTNAPKPPDTCTQDELYSHPGDCWIKLSVWEKRVAFMGFEYGWLHSYEFAKRQQYNRIGRSHVKFLARFDASKVISYFDQLYSVQENRPILWDDAFDLLFRTETNPNTKDIPGLTALYQKREQPLFSGYLRKFVPPNRVVVSEYNDAFLPTQVRNQTVTITLLSVSADTNTKAVTDFMAALLNVKQCHTLIRETERYKFNTYFKTDKDKQQAKEIDERGFYPQLKVVIEYPGAYDYQQEEFFNGRNELSGIVLLEKYQSVCIEREGELAFPVRLSELMLEGVKNNEFNAYHFERSAENDFINLNQYLIANGLRTVDREEDDPRPAHLYFSLFNADQTPDGIKKILTIGAAQ